jgi:hypothetical protein
MAQQLGKLGALKSGVSVKKAAAIISVSTSSETYTELVGDHGWSYDAVERWVIQSLTEQLLK